MKNTVPVKVVVRSKRGTYTAVRHKKPFEVKEKSSKKGDSSQKDSQQMKAVKDFEKSIMYKDVENAFLIGEKGEEVQNYQGGRKHISVNPMGAAKMKGVENMVFTHNHPIAAKYEDKDVIYSLSKNDVAYFLISGVKEFRAVNELGHVFRLTRTPETVDNFHSDESMVYYTGSFYAYSDKVEAMSELDSQPDMKKQAYAQHLFNIDLAKKGKFRYVVEGMKDPKTEFFTHET